MSRDAEYKEARRLREAGLSYGQIAVELEVIHGQLISPGTIARWANDIKVDKHKVIKNVSNNKIQTRLASLASTDFKNGSALRKYLLDTREYVCSSCGISNWKDNYIPLEVHHKDGNKNNNKEDNLEWLCPNCHSQTDNWRNKRGKLIYD